MDRNFALGYALGYRDLFINFKSKKVNLNYKTSFDRHFRRAAANIFCKCFELVINDIIDNNIQFKLPPVGNGSSYLQMKRFSGNVFKKLFKAGKWRNIDFLMSDFCGYQIAFYTNNKKKLGHEKLIYLSSKYNDKIAEKVNKGFTY